MLSSCGLASAQDDGANPWFVRAGMNPAYILPTNPFLDAANANDAIRWAPNLTFEIGRHTDGSQTWHELYGLPSFGFGVSLVSFGDRESSGRPLEAYTFFSWPFVRLSEQVALTTDFGMGLSWRWKRWNDATREYDEVLSSNLEARIDWGFYARYKSTPRTALYAGIDFTHRSNGGMVQPNLGINVIGPKVALQYSFSDEARTRPTAPAGPFKPSWEIVVGGAGGVKNVVERKDPVARGDFGALNATAAAQRQFYRYGKIAAGTDLTYDGSAGARIDADGTRVRGGFGQRWGLGFYGGYEHVVGRFGAIVQAGATVLRADAISDAPRVYSRFGWRYRINDRLWTGLAIRAYGFHEANALEFGAGYRVELKDGHR